MCIILVFFLFNLLATIWSIQVAKYLRAVVYLTINFEYLINGQYDSKFENA